MTRNIDDKKFYKVKLKSLRYPYKLILTAIISALFLVLTTYAEEIRYINMNNEFYYYLSELVGFLCLSISVGVWVFYLIKKFGKIKKQKNHIIHNLKYYIRANKLYESEIIQNSKGRRIEVIRNSIILGYYEDPAQHILIIRGYKQADKYNDLVNKLDTGLSALLGLAISNKVDTNTYCDYIFQTIPDEKIIVSSNTGREYNNSPIIPLNNNLSWNISKQPHALVCGGTGSGKTYFLNYLILEFLKKHSELYICDPKNSDLGQLKSYLGADRVATDGNNIAKICRLADEAMEQRYTEMNNNFVYGSNYIDHNYNPIVLFFDELGAFRASADKKTYEEAMAHLRAVILKGRQAGVFVILATQQPNANNIPTEIRDNLSMIVALGNMSNQGYQMCFGETVKDLQSISGAGCGYLYLDGMGWEKPRYFEAPYIDKNFNFIEEIKQYS